MRWLSGYDIMPLDSSLPSKCLSASISPKLCPSSIIMMHLPPGELEQPATLQHMIVSWQLRGGGRRRVLLRILPYFALDQDLQSSGGEPPEARRAYGGGERGIRTLETVTRLHAF